MIWKLISFYCVVLYNNILKGIHVLKTANYTADIHIYFSNNEGKIVQESLSALQNIIIKKSDKNLLILLTYYQYSLKCLAICKLYHETNIKLF